MQGRAASLLLELHTGARRGVTQGPNPSFLGLNFLGVTQPAVSTRQHEISASCSMHLPSLTRDTEIGKIDTYSLRCSKGSRLGHDCAYQGVINYHGVFPVCPY
jgi:hypothetical protein